MAESVVFGIVQKIVTELGSLAVQEIGSAWGVKKELQDLKIILSTIKALLPHAEEIERTNPTVKEWLRRIKDVAYEAEDIIDEFSIEATRRKQLVHENPIKKVCFFVSLSNPITFRFKMATRIKEISRTLALIESCKSFQLEVKIPNSERLQTHSYVDGSRMLGRDDEKHKIVELLLDLDGVDRLAVIPVQGLGGIGKTTLAQLVRNDEQVNSHFELKMWVCVSEKFDVDKVIGSIIESATEKECPKLKMDLLQSRLREEIKKKRFLLVLDDVWNEDAEKWGILKELLMVGASGSKIIVTTRSKKVASLMGTVSTRQLLGLSNDDCWSLFKERAFEEGQEERHPNLVGIGKEIVKKCGGVPLAAKTLGSLMQSKKTEHEWLHVSRSDVWNLPQEENGILPSLRLSFNHMSFSLRQCFAYCSLFPKGYTFSKRDLVNLWVAQGFITSSDGEDSTLEEFGGQYVEELIGRSFFQDAELSYGVTRSFKMHDLVHDLAQFVAGVECFTVKEGSKKHIPQGVRHLCIDDESFPLETLKTPNLRTLILRSRSYRSVGNIISTLKFLRVLHLENYCDDYLPDSLCKLDHLRYLCIESNSITKLPKAITKLQSLQYLNIWCEKLEELPKYLEKMISLRYIWLNPDSRLTYMPIRIGIVGEVSGSKLNELKGLRNLRDMLTIKNLEHVSSSSDTTDVNLKEKPKLVKLVLVWNEVQESVISVETAFDVLETLEPHGYLKELEIRGYGGARFANWMMLEESLLPNLTRVTLSGCRKCRELPHFGQLRFLEALCLEEMDALEFIGSSRQGSNQKELFVSLRELCLQDLPNLRGWLTKKGYEQEQPEVSMSLNCLAKLSVLHCPNLTTIPLVPSLQKLNLEGCCKILVQSILLPQQLIPLESDQILLSKLEDLNIKHCDDLASLPLQGLTSLIFLRIENCPRLTSFTEEELQGLSSLLDLRIIGCESFTALSAGMCHLTSLKTFYLENLSKLLSLPDDVHKSTKLQYLGIVDCEGLTSLPNELGSLTSLRKLVIWNCPNLESLPDSMQLLTNLQRLDIYCDGLLRVPDWLGNLKSVKELSVSSSLDHLPEQLQHLPSVQNLYIQYCEGLVSLPNWILNFSSLQRLEIQECPSLQYLPEQMKKLTRLKRLEIEYCNKLTFRCKKETGEEWSKVAHVPTIILDKASIQEN